MRGWKRKLWLITPGSTERKGGEVEKNAMKPHLLGHVNSFYRQDFHPARADLFISWLIVELNLAFGEFELLVKQI